MSTSARTGNVAALRPDDHRDAAGAALRWAADRHRKALGEAYDRILESWLPEEGESDPDELEMQMISVCVGEWLLARGEMHSAKRGRRRLLDLVLGPDGPYLTPGQRSWLEQMRTRPLRLYRVTDVRPGEGMTLVDELDDTLPPRQVQERLGSTEAKPGLLIGARLMEVPEPAGGSRLELSGAIYTFHLAAEASAKEAVRAAADSELALARAWMAQWFEPPALPQIRDASTGEPMLLVADHYRVLDAGALASALAAQADVQGSAAAGWQRQVTGDDGLVRSLAAINAGRQADRIEIFYRTQRLADDGRRWFDEVAGDAVAFLTREITDPAGAMLHRDADDRGAATTEPVRPPLPPEELAQVIEQVLRRQYAHWCDEPIPVLDGKTPRQAIATPAGLERVKGLLRSYEAGEREQSAEQGRPPFSFQFLWDGLGITR
ncbi:MAG: DUF2384 domain-containing protein [Rubrivivax sp.]|nr:DUF2384 domain-containing protein [Rubrivivax sp.]